MMRRNCTGRSGDFQGHKNEDSQTLINNRQNGRRRGRGGGGPQQLRGPNNGGDRGNRIDNRARGNAAQLLEKYKNLARDAQTQGDRVMTEYYHQFADHYFRVLAETRSRFEDQNQHQQRRPRFDNEDYDGEGDEGEGIDEGGEAEAREPQQEQQPQYRRDRGDREDRGNRRDDREDRGREERARDDRGNREDRGNRRERRDYREPVAAAPAEAAPAVAIEQPVAAVEVEEAPKPRRGRPRKVKAEAEADAPQRIEVDRLPPSFGASAGEDANGHAEEPAEAAPRKRRTRRASSSEADVAA